MNENKIGYIYAVCAFLFWGLTPIYYKQIQNVEPFEVLAHRVVWSIVILFILLFVSKQFGYLKDIFKSLKKLKYLTFTSFLISLNWFIYIYAIVNDKIVEAALGYFINPLVNVALGFIVFNERMSKYQSLAIFVALIGVLYEIVTLGTVPVISLVLAVSFGFYGMIRKKIEISSIPGLFVETIILFPFAFIYLYNNSNLAFVNSDNYTVFILSLSGIVTVLPLLWFNKAALKMKLSTLGFFQYLGPTVAFLVGIFIYNEELNFNKLISFICIWIALIIFSADNILRKKN